MTQGSGHQRLQPRHRPYKLNISADRGGKDKAIDREFIPMRVMVGRYRARGCNLDSVSCLPSVADGGSQVVACKE